MGKEDWYFVISTVLAILALLGMDWKLVWGRVSVHPSQTREILLLLAVVGSLLLSAVGWYKSSHWTALKPEQMEQVFRKEFINEAVEMDGRNFEDCHFVNVTLVVKGEKQFSLSHNHFEGIIKIQNTKRIPKEISQFLVAFLREASLLDKQVVVVDGNGDLIVRPRPAS